jgi:hypothetical protein
MLPIADGTRFNYLLFSYIFICSSTVLLVLFCSCLAQVTADDLNINSTVVRQCDTMPAMVVHLGGSQICSIFCISFINKLQLPNYILYGAAVHFFLADGDLQQRE